MQAKKGQNKNSQKNRNQGQRPGQQKSQKKVARSLDIHNSAPVATSSRIRVQKPKMKMNAKGDCIISHREYIGELIAGTGTPSIFTIQQYSINPGQVTVFPWLSRIAQNYESYRFKKLRFIYETEASTTVPGSVLIGIDYDAADNAPVNKQQLMTYRGSVRTAPWADCSHVSANEDLNKQKSFFIRTGPVPNTDIKTYDVGLLFVCSQGQAAGTLLGEIYVEYDIELMTPVQVLATPSGSVFNTTGTGAGTGDFLGTGFLSRGELIITKDPASNNRFQINGTNPDSYYYVSVAVAGTGLSGEITQSAIFGCARLAEVSPISVADTALCSVGYFRSTIGSFFTIDCVDPTAVTTITSSSIVVAQVAQIF